MVVGININSTAILDGFTIKSGNANGTSSGYGGGIYNFNSSPTLSNLTIKGNSADFAGGGMANDLAVNVPSLKAAVAFYGRQPAAADVPKIKAALQLHYAGLDDRVNAGIPAYEEALKKAGTTYEIYIYEGVNHAFHNDTAPTRYNEAAAKLAWQRTIEFFGKYLK